MLSSIDKNTRRYPKSNTRRVKNTVLDMGVTGVMGNLGKLENLMSSG